MAAEEKAEDPTCAESESTGFSANLDDETRANIIAKRLHLRSVQKGKGKGWTPILRYALEKAADEGTFLAAVEQHHAELDRLAGERIRFLAAELRELRQKQELEGYQAPKRSSKT